MHLAPGVGAAVTPVNADAARGSRISSGRGWGSFKEGWERKSQISLDGCCRLSRKRHSRDAGSSPGCQSSPSLLAAVWVVQGLLQRQVRHQTPEDETLVAGGVVSCSRGKQRPGCLAEEICKEGLKAQPTFLPLLSVDSGERHLEGRMAEEGK